MKRERKMLDKERKKYWVKREINAGQKKKEILGEKGKKYWSGG